MADFKYVRDKNRVYARVEGSTRFVLNQTFKSISAAKHATNTLEKVERGCVRRRETLEKTLGPKTVKDMLNEQ